MSEAKQTRKPIKKKTKKNIIKFYISGPMTGYEDYNFPAFNKMALILRKKGYDVFNPAELFNGEQNHPRKEYMYKDIKGLLTCNCVMLLDGWEKSTGAKLEVQIARELDLFIYKYSSDSLYPLEEQKFPDEELEKRLFPDDENSCTETICEEADRLVSTDRQEQYGHPLDNFTDIGRVWGTVLGIPDIAPEKVGLMMAGLKICREKYKHKRDNLVDGAGFFKTVDLIHMEKEYRKFKNSLN